MYFTSLYVRQITSKFNSKMQDFKRALNVNCNLVLPNGSKYVRDVIQWHENSFSLKNYEKSLSSSGLRPHTPVCDTFKVQYIFYLNASTNLDTFRILPIGLSPLLKRVPSYVPTPGHGF